MKKKLLIVGGILFVLIMVIWLSAGSSPEVKKSFEAGKQKAQQGLTKKDLASGNETQTEIENAVKDVMDDKHLKEIRVVPVEDNYALEGGKYNVTVSFYVDGSGNMAASAVKLKTTEVLASLFLKDMGVNEVWTMAWYPFESNPEMVLKTSMNRDIAKKTTHDSKMSFQYDAEKLMIVEKSSFPELPVSKIAPTAKPQNLQGTDSEKEIFNYAMNLYNKYSATLDSYEAETKSTKETAEHFSISPDEVEKIIYKLQ